MIKDKLVRLPDKSDSTNPQEIKKQKVRDIHNKLLTLEKNEFMLITGVNPEEKDKPKYCKSIIDTIKEAIDILKKKELNNPGQSEEDNKQLDKELGIEEFDF